MSDSLEATIAKLLTVQEAQDVKLDRILKLLDGNGTPGMLIRMDRLEQAENRRKWGVRALAGAIVGIVGRMIWGMFN